MQTPMVRDRMDLVEEELFNLSTRMINNESKTDATNRSLEALTNNVAQILRMMESKKTAEERTPAVNEEIRIPLNTEMKSFMPKYNEEEELPYKPSRRDRESIASFYTSEAVTPISASLKIIDKEKTKPDFILEYEKIKSNDEATASGSNLIAEVTIPESSKFNSVTLKTIKLATDKLQLLRTENPTGAKKLKLAYFFSQTAMDSIYNKQISIKGNALLIYENPARLYLAEDDVFLKLLCDTIRPVSAEDHLSKLLQVIQLDYINEEFQFKDFHKKHLPKAMHQLNKLKVFDTFIRYMASPSDLNMLILNGYGKEKAPQMTRVILAFFGTLQERIIMGINEEKLKKMTTPTEVFTAIHKYLTKLANQAHEYELDENASNTCPNVLSAFAKLKKKSFENADRQNFHSLKYMGDDARSLPVKNPLDNHDMPTDEDTPDLIAEFDDEDNHIDELEEEDTLMFVNPKDVHNKAQKDTKSMPCYKTIFGKTCEDGSNCKYSHNRELLTKYVSASMDKWSKSPYATTTTNAHKHQDRRPFGHPNQEKYLSTKGNLRILQRNEDLPVGNHE